MKQRTKSPSISRCGYLSDVAEERLGSPNPRLAPADWKSGERLSLVHLFAPFGHHEQALKELRETSLAGKSLKIRRLGLDGQSVTEVLPALVEDPGAT
jgi:cytolysin-activating lysine-acyltransferase